MISHERLDRLLDRYFRRGLARSIAHVANRHTAASYDAVVCTTGSRAKSSIASTRRTS